MAFADIKNGEPYALRLLPFTLQNTTVFTVQSSIYSLIYIIHPASTTLITVPARVASSAPAKVNLVFVTFAARKYTLMV